MRESTFEIEKLGTLIFDIGSGRLQALQGTAAALRFVNELLVTIGDGTMRVAPPGFKFPKPDFEF